MELVRKALQVWRSEGTLSVTTKSLAYLHRRLRPLLPSKSYTLMNGVEVAEPEFDNSRVLDDLVPWPVPRSNYKQANVQGIRETVREGDDVIIVGGGFGVTTVVAARQVGPTGHVRSYEVSPERAAKVRRTVKRNNVADRCEVIEAIVGEAKKVAGSSDEETLRAAEQRVEHLSPAELANCDVMELDCEGAELAILAGLTIQPRAVVVEVHPVEGVHGTAVEELLGEQGYSISSKTERQNGMVYTFRFEG